MKLLLVILAAFLGSLSVYAQVAPDPVFWANLDRTKSVKKFGIGTLDLHMNYFGEVLGPNLGKMDDHQYDERGNKLRDPVTMLHSLTINHQFNPNLRLAISPRFMTPLGEKNDLRQTDDQSSVAMDDWFVGLSQTWIRTTKWSWDTRLGDRLATSTKSKNEGVDGQVEMRQGVTFRARPELTIATQFNIRYYLYEPDVEQKRYRLNQTTFVNYTHTDRWNMQLMYEYEQQHRAPTQGKGTRAFNHMLKNKDQLALGVGYSVTRDFNIMPFIKTLDNANIRPETMQAGLWVSANVF